MRAKNKALKYSSLITQVPKVNSPNTFNSVFAIFIFLRNTFCFHGSPIKTSRNLNYAEHPLQNAITHCLIFPLNVAYINRAIKSLLDCISISFGIEN